MSRLTYNYKEEYCETNAKRWDIDIEHLRKTYEGRVYFPNHNVRKEDMWHKLGQLEDIEEAIGIDLVVREQALNDGFYYIDEQKNIVHVMNYTSNRSYGFVCAEYDFISYYEICMGELRKECNFYYKDYGKKDKGGWALTKEELAL